MDVDGAVAHGDPLFLILAPGEDEAGGHDAVARLGLDELQRGTHGVGGGVGGTAQQAVGLAHLHQHGAEIIGLGQIGAALLGGHLALAEHDHLFHHLVHAGIGSRIDDPGAGNIVAALFGSRPDAVGRTDQNDPQEASLQELRSRIQDAGILAFGEDDGAVIGFQRFDQFLKHSQTSLSSGRHARSDTVFYTPLFICTSPFSAFRRLFAAVGAHLPVAKGAVDGVN